MTDEIRVALLMVAAVLLPVILLVLVALGDRVLGHPRYRRLRWKLYELQRSHPVAFTGVLAILAFPALAHFVAESDWLMIAFFTLELVFAHRVAAHASPPFSEGPEGW